MTPSTVTLVRSPAEPSPQPSSPVRDDRHHRDLSLPPSCRDAAVVRELGSCSSRPPVAVADAAQSASQTSADATVLRIPPSSSRSGSPIQIFFFKS